MLCGQALNQKQGCLRHPLVVSLDFSASAPHILQPSQANCTTHTPAKASCNFTLSHKITPSHSLQTVKERFSFQRHSCPPVFFSVTSNSSHLFFLLATFHEFFVSLGSSFTTSSVYSNIPSAAAATTASSTVSHQVSLSHLWLSFKLCFTLFWIMH